MDCPDLESCDRRDEIDTRGSHISKYFPFKLQIAIFRSRLNYRRENQNGEKGRERFLLILNGKNL